MNKRIENPFVNIKLIFLLLTLSTAKHIENHSFGRTSTECDKKVLATSKKMLQQVNILKAAPQS